MASNRGYLWRFGLSTIQAEPWLGIGPEWGTLIEASQPYLPEKMLNRKAGAHPHNMYLTLGAQVGIPGLVFFSLLYFFVLQGLWSKIKQWNNTHIPTMRELYIGQAILIGLLTILFQGIFISVHLDPYLWLFLGAGTAYIYLNRSSGGNIPS